MASIQILLNGVPLQLPQPMDVAALLRHLQLGERRVAIEVNRAIVPRSQHAGYPLHDGDAVELVQAMGGG